jgi:replication factor C subunit 3/5
MSDEKRLWMEKYRPITIEEGRKFYNAKIFDLIKKLAQFQDFPHILFYGASGVGKRTLTKCLLHELYGESVHKIIT